jgi:hypothetical protein
MTRAQFMLVFYLRRARHHTRQHMGSQVVENFFRKVRNNSGGAANADSINGQAFLDVYLASKHREAPQEEPQRHSEADSELSGSCPTPGLRIPAEDAMRLFFIEGKKRAIALSDRLGIDGERMLASVAPGSSADKLPAVARGANLEPRMAPLTSRSTRHVSPCPGQPMSDAFGAPVSA